MSEKVEKRRSAYIEADFCTSGFTEGVVTMSSLSRELVFLILQFLDEEKFKETVHKLEQESGFFFNMRYFEDEVHNGNWDEVERYLSGFTKLFKEITQLLTLENFRENEQLSKYGDTKSARAIMLLVLKKLMEANPLFRDKLQFPNLKNSRLRTLINQSLNWQHQLCKNPRPNPDIKTLVDHSCGQPNGARPFQPTPAAVPAPLAGWMSNPPTVTHPAISVELLHPRTPPTNPSVDYPSGDSDHVSKRRAMGIMNIFFMLYLSNAGKSSVNVLPVSFSGHGHSQALNAPDDLPKTVARTLNQGSAPMSMDFHPIQQTLLLVGTNVGDIALWEVGSRERLVLRNFKVWDLSVCSMPLQGALVKDPSVSVNRIIWSPDGSLFGVAYSRHIVQIYSYHGADDVRQHLEIDAHVGGVNDLAFSHPNKQLCVITCGDDKTIKVWEAALVQNNLLFEGHEAPVYSVCPHYKENIQFIFSTALDGKIKAWLYDNMGSRVDYDAPGRWCTTMAYSADGTRLFSCGTSKDGESHIVEWNESEGAVKRTYQGLRKRSMGVASPRSASTRTDLSWLFLHDNGIKILANSDGLRWLRIFKNPSYDAARASENAIKPTINAMSAAAAATSAGLGDRAASVVAISAMISRLIYTNSGNAILALAPNAIHLLWKWQRSDRNSGGKATANVSPQLWQPSSGILMTNDVTDTNPEDAVPCFALSKNDSYTMTTFMPPPPAATFLAFHPQDNNIIAIGMDDSTIQIYNVRVDEVKSKLKGHSKRITGLAFSHVLNVLVSSGADAQLCVWSSDGWEKQKNRFLQMPSGRTPTAQSDTKQTWAPRVSVAPFFHATFSCDSQLVYASFLDAPVCVFTAANLRLRCRINPPSYLSPSVRDDLPSMKSSLQLKCPPTSDWRIHKNQISLRWVYQMAESMSLSHLNRKANGEYLHQLRTGQQAVYQLHLQLVDLQARINLKDDRVAAKHGFFYMLSLAGPFQDADV
ncbi:Protein TOPLESS [Camellia lanceoleosa]|nr:Protein TOPLESS [Camellia lanceoleosa]